MLEEKIAVVTGASRGIGRAIAKELALKGAFVIVNYNGSKQAAETHFLLFPALNREIISVISLLLAFFRRRYFFILMYFSMVLSILKPKTKLFCGFWKTQKSDFIKSLE
mgnify:CR=1 FL=1